MFILYRFFFRFVFLIDFWSIVCRFWDRFWSILGGFWASVIFRIDFLKIFACFMWLSIVDPVDFRFVKTILVCLYMNLWRKCGRLVEAIMRFVNVFSCDFL